MENGNAAESPYPALIHEGDRATLVKGLSVAVVVHLLVLLVALPERSSPIAPRPPRPAPPNLERYQIRPPDVERPKTERTERLKKRVPWPDTEMEDLGPVEESDPTESFEAEPGDVLFDFVIPEGQAPLASGPKIPGGDVLPPVLIEETKISPFYPELARQARLGGSVTLQAVIRADGTVDEVEVLRCNEPGLGFEEASIEAVRRWRYEPATQRGVPVDVYFTIQVVFALQ